MWFILKIGKCFYAEGTVYEGEFKNEKPNGKGIHWYFTKNMTNLRALLPITGKYAYSNKDTYEGELLNEKPHG